MKRLDDDAQTMLDGVEATLSAEGRLDKRSEVAWKLRERAEVLSAALTDAAARRALVVQATAEMAMLVDPAQHLADLLAVAGALETTEPPTGTARATFDQLWSELATTNKLHLRNEIAAQYRQRRALLGDPEVRRGRATELASEIPMLALDLERYVGLLVAVADALVDRDTAEK